MPAGRPLSEEAAYAKELGLKHRRPCQRVRLLGGVKKLKAMDESTRNVLLAGTGPTPRKWGLEARGIPVCKPHSVQKRAEYEALVQRMLQERGLVK